MSRNILIIDDDEVIHLLLSKLLAEDYHLFDAKDAQEAINIFSEHPIHLIISDIHMPGIDGLEFLEALTADADNKNVPVLIMTGQPTVDKEKLALNLGAADFIDKQLFADDREAVLDRINAKIVTRIDVENIPKSLSLDKKNFVKKLMDEVRFGDFFTISRSLGNLLKTHFLIDHIFFWNIVDKKPRLILTMGAKSLLNLGPDDLLKEPFFKDFLTKKRPYFHNNIYHDDIGIFPNRSKEADLPAELGVPLFALNEKKLIQNKMKIPPGTPLFGYMVLKRKKMFTDKEFSVISRLLIQSGTILWRFYQKI